MTPQEFKLMISNPFYCLDKISELYVQEHEPLISEKQWIEANVNLIKEMGPKKWLQLLLTNLKGK
jgi:hypothetical protein